MNLQFAAWNIRGMTNTSKQDEVKLLISENNLKMCAVIETRLIKKVVNSVCNNVFGNWDWVSNSVDSSKGCRIAVGWDPHSISANLLASNAQVMHFEVTIIRENKKFFISIIYGDNEAKERVKLWSNLINHMAVIDNKPWVILGDFNVIRYADEHSLGVVDKNHGVSEFRNCIDMIGMEDLAKNGFFFT